VPSGISPKALKGLLAGNSQLALIDVREAGEYNSSHIPGASLIARRQLESQLPLKRRSLAAGRRLPGSWG